MSTATGPAAEAALNSSDVNAPQIPCRTDSRRRPAIKCGVAMATAVMLFDIYPPEHFAWPKFKQRFSQAVGLCGVEQNQWRLFAPDPELHLWWFEAEIDDGSTRDRQWISPQWPLASNWEKFYRFRELNYYDRIGQTANEAALTDLTNWIRQQQVAPEQVRSVTLYKVEKVMLSNPAEFPAADETMWTFSRLRVAHQEYTSP